MIDGPIPEGLTFDDVLLLPGKSTVLPAEVDTRTCFTRKFREKCRRHVDRNTCYARFFYFRRNQRHASGFNHHVAFGEVFRAMSTQEKRNVWVLFQFFH